MPKLRVGVQLNQRHATWEGYAKAVRDAEALGVDSLWAADHFFPTGGEGNGNYFEGWSLVTAMAGMTSRAEVGCLVSCNSYRNPNLLTHMAKTVDHISGGRLILGIGAGWFEKDYVEFGYEFGTAPERLRALADSLPVIKARMAAEVPPPLRNPIPIMIGGGGEKVTLKLVAQYADLWNAGGPPDSYAHKNRILDDWCENLGRDPAAIERTVIITDTEFPHNLDAYVQAGASHIIMSRFEPWDMRPVEELVRWCEAQS